MNMHAPLQVRNEVQYWQVQKHNRRWHQNISPNHVQALLCHKTAPLHTDPYLVPVLELLSIQSHGEVCVRVSTKMIHFEQVYCNCSLCCCVPVPHERLKACTRVSADLQERCTVSVTVTRWQIQAISLILQHHAKRQNPCFTDIFAIVMSGLERAYSLHCYARMPCTVYNH